MVWVETKVALANHRKIRSPWYRFPVFCQCDLCFYPEGLNSMTPSHWKNPTRRQVLSASALATVAIPMAALPGRALAEADRLPRVGTDQQADAVLVERGQHVIAAAVKQTAKFRYQLCENRLRNRRNRATPAISPGFDTKNRESRFYIPPRVKPPSTLRTCPVT